jgi:enoyl-CoA hydratase/carnithine racemase
MSEPNGGSESHILVDKAAGLCTITFNRPEKKNAFTVAMYDACIAALADAAQDPAVRCVLFAAHGSAFTAGNDLMDFMSAPPTGEDSSVFRFLLALIEYEKPIVVAVNGAAVGIGVTMLMHCDLVYAADTAKFTAPFVSLGLVPEAGSSWILPRMAGHAKANEILLLGEPFDAATAKDVGLVTRAVPAAELLETARGKCQRLIELPAASLRESKKLLRGNVREQVKRALYDEAIVFAARLGSPEAAEAFTAFFEKRKPDFSRFD